MQFALLAARSAQVLQLARVPAKSALAEVIPYALGYGKGLSLFLEDGRVEIDSNTIERKIRPIKPSATCSPAPMTAPIAGPSSPHWSRRQS